MRNKRLYALVLLFALALLQMRVAFACDFGSPQAMDSSATSCDGCKAHDYATPVADDLAGSCSPSTCAEMSGAQADDAPVLGAAASVVAHLSPHFALAAERDDEPLRASITPAHRAHTRRIYVLQRLLI